MEKRNTIAPILKNKIYLYLTDDKAPVELLGMRAIDQLVLEEPEIYKKMYKEKGLRGVLDDLL